MQRARGGGASVAQARRYASVAAPRGANDNNCSRQQLAILAIVLVFVATATPAPGRQWPASRLVEQPELGQLGKYARRGSPRWLLT